MLGTEQLITKTIGQRDYYQKLEPEVLLRRCWYQKVPQTGLRVLHKKLNLPYPRNQLQINKKTNHCCRQWKGFWWRILTCSVMRYYHRFWKCIFRTSWSQSWINARHWRNPKTSQNHRVKNGYEIHLNRVRIWCKKRIWIECMWIGQRWKLWWKRKHIFLFRSSI